MKRIAIIHAWFGPLPNYFDLWLNSCKRNRTIDFYILTDQSIVEDSNINLVKSSLGGAKKQLEDYLGFEISLERPYKLCDFKVLFDVLVPQVKEYDFWGFCDCDLVFGNIRKFVTEDVLDRFSYIGVLGHLHLQKCNYPVFEKVLRQSVTRRGYTYKDVYTNPQNYIFDELPFGLPRQIIDEIPNEVYSFHEPDGRQFESPTDALPGFVDTYNNADEMEEAYRTTMYAKHANDIDCWKRTSGKRNKKWIFYRYDNGTLKSCFWENGEYAETEILYAHLFRRKMEIQIDMTSANFNIIPNLFVGYEVTQNEVRWRYLLDRFRCYKINYKRYIYNMKVAISKMIRRS